MIKGICKYCNQVILVNENEVDDIDDENSVSEAVLRVCECGGAAHHRFLQMKKEKAIENISLAFHENNESIERIMAEAVPDVISQKIAKITIQGDKGIKGTMSMDAKGNIKVKGQYKKEAEYSE